MRSVGHRALLALVPAMLCVLAPGPSIGQTGAKAAGPTAATSLTDVELLAIMVQVVQRIEVCIRTNEIDLIHNEDTIARVPYAEFMKEARTPSGVDPQAFRMAVFGVGSTILGLHTAADDSDRAALEERFPRVVEALARLKTFFPAKTVAAAEALAGRYTCPMHPEVVGKRTDACPKCGMELDQLVRVLPPDASASVRTIRAGVRLATPLVVGQPAEGVLILTKEDGSPVTPTDLIEVHTARIHLLLIDPSLTDYHHEHPRPTAIPGEYAFAFTPRVAGGYRVWADVRPYPLGLQEYAMADIPAATAATTPIDRRVTSKVEVDGLRFELILPRQALRVGRVTPARLRVTGSDGTPFAALEPLMETFAHLVAFNEDYTTVLHMHPRGAPVLNPAERGGPELEFRIYPLRPGFFRLFAQVQVGGTSKFAPFGLSVAR